MHKIGAFLVLEEALQRPQLQSCHGEVAWVLHLGLFEQLSSWVSPGISASSPHLWTHWGSANSRALSSILPLPPSLPWFAASFRTYVALFLYLKLINRKERKINRSCIGMWGYMRRLTWANPTLLSHPAPSFLHPCPTPSPHSCSPVLTADRNNSPGRCLCKTCSG